MEGANYRMWSEYLGIVCSRYQLRKSKKCRTMNVQYAVGMERKSMAMSKDHQRATLVSSTPKGSVLLHSHEGSHALRKFGATPSNRLLYHINANVIIIHFLHLINSRPFSTTETA